MWGVTYARVARRSELQMCLGMKAAAEPHFPGQPKNGHIFGLLGPTWEGKKKRVCQNPQAVALQFFSEGFTTNSTFLSQAPGKQMTKERDLLANLAVLNYEKLVRKDPAEASKLLHACSRIGFFYLDLSCVTAENYRNLVSALNRRSQEYFSRPLKEKMKDMNDEWEVFNICG